jgi:hypothetical protein
MRPATRNIDSNLLDVLLCILSNRVGEICAHTFFNIHSFSMTLNYWKRITLASLGYAKRVGRSSYSKRQQCQQCLCMNKLCTPIFGQHFYQKEYAGYSRKYGTCVKYILNNVEMFNKPSHTRICKYTCQLWSPGLWSQVILYMVINALKEHIISIFRVTYTLKIKVIRSFKMLVSAYKTTWQHNPEDHNWS